MPPERVVISGPLDFASVPDHLAPLLAASDRPAPAVLVDLSACDFIDSTGLRALVDASLRARRRGGDLHVVSPSPPVAKLIALADLGIMLPTLDTGQSQATGSRVTP